MDKCKRKSKIATLVAELLVLPDGRILAHNLTPAMARVLAELMPDDEDMRRRAAANK